MRKRHLLYGAILLAQGEAFAQSALEEIIVTAQRRAESIQDVPVSVTAVTSDMLNVRSVHNLEQLSLLAPSLQMGQDNTFAVRGVGTLAFSQTVDSSVAMAIDEVNLGRPALGGQLFNDVARVEVLNGPQGLLFGRNASAGLLNIITQEPVLGSTEGSVEFEYHLRDTTPDDGDGYVFRGVFNTPVTENSALRLNAYWQDQDPIAKRIGGGAQKVEENAERRGLKAKFLVEPSDDLSLYFIADYNQEEGIAGQFDRSWRAIGNPSVNAPVLAAEGITPGKENLEYMTDGNMFRDVDTGGLQAKVTYEINDTFEISNIAAWKFMETEQSLDVDWTSEDSISTNYVDSDYDQFSNELRLGVDADRIDGQVGLYYFKSSADAKGFLHGNPFPAPFPVSATMGSDNDTTQKHTSYAMFGQFNLHATDDLSFIVGARLTRDKIELKGIQNQGTYLIPFGPSATFDESHSNTNFSWKLGLQYDFSYDAMVYATVSSGYKSPGFNNAVGDPNASPVVDEETSTNYELGFKSSWLNQRLIFNATLFLQKFDDYQVESFDPVLRSFSIGNAAELETRGAELTLTALPMDGLTLNASLTYLDTEFGNYPGAQCYPGQATASCAVDGTFNAKGLGLPLSPDVTSTVQAMYEFRLGNGLDGFIEANWYHRSEMHFLVNQAPGAKLGSLNIFGASVGVRSDNGWSASLFCKNCTDEVHPTFIAYDPADADVNGVASYQQAWGYNSVRTIGIRASYAF